MKTIQQVIGYLEGWKHAISAGDAELDKDNQVLQAIEDIIDYIEPNKQEDTITSIYNADQYIKTIPANDKKIEYKVVRNPC